MRRPLPQRTLRFATAQAYDLSPQGSGRFWVERAAEQFSLAEAISASHGHDSTADAGAETAGKTERNPLRDEPGPLAVGAVKRFGLVGLVSVAVGAGIARWWNSFSSRDH